MGGLIEHLRNQFSLVGTHPSRRKHTNSHVSNITTLERANADDSLSNQDRHNRSGRKSRHTMGYCFLSLASSLALAWTHIHASDRAELPWHTSFQNWHAIR